MSDNTDHLATLDDEQLTELQKDTQLLNADIERELIRRGLVKKSVSPFGDIPLWPGQKPAFAPKQPWK